MKYTIITVFLAAFAAAKTIDELVEDIPTCAVTCIRDAASLVNCEISDFACSCSKKDQLTPSVVSCLSKSSCTADDQTKVLMTANDICDQVGTVNAATGTETGAATSTSPAAAPRVQVAGWTGALALIAAAAL